MPAIRHRLLPKISRAPIRPSEVSHSALCHPPVRPAIDKTRFHVDLLYAVRQVHSERSLPESLADSGSNLGERIR
jgi:hypothetical protein